MGKNKAKGIKANVFKVAGAKSLKKTKAKAVNLGLKNIKDKVKEIDAQFLQIKENPKPTQKTETKEAKTVKRKPQKPNLTKEDLEKTTEAIVKMDL